MKKSVAICDTQPVTAAGLRAILEACPDLEFSRAGDCLPAALEIVRTFQPALLILDKAFGAQAVVDTLDELKMTGWHGAVVVWGVSMTEAEALRFVRAGARGIIRKSADQETLLVCLRSVAAGATWMERSVFRFDARRDRRRARSDLTPREQQVMELVGQGLKNREVAAELGISPGTVKVHLKHIFEKTGAQGRYNLALAGLTTDSRRVEVMSGSRPISAAAAL
ncbi:MAG TPA: response regulator transcription factor [Bryobacteraceae bacterium]|nr:response regulator transcription factor [Bryobacteraceae bacterium]HPU73457.1 response regulator transcription factor [Bryobacteraceae bacterium]